MIRHIFTTKTAYGCSPLLYGYHSGTSRRTDKVEGHYTYVASLAESTEATIVICQQSSMRTKRMRTRNVTH